VDQVMTIAEIENQFVDEWVLLSDPIGDNVFQVQAGKVLWHSKDRDEVYRRALELGPDYAAFLYTGKPSDEMAVLL
jgi:hypothetical protein